jgi:hypothetical protein
MPCAERGADRRMSEIPEASSDDTDQSVHGQYLSPSLTSEMRREKWEEFTILS